ncbi:MAG: ABC transporter ATP-binding protein [Bacillota bacterium]|nr:ABC transporter ATP-binding protein [Bacillota bacterium]
MVEVSDLRYRYPTGKDDVIRGISFAFKRGEIFGFLGPSGAGKSTTQKLLIGILKGFRGQVRYQGKDLGAYGREIYRDIGVGFEVPVHFSKLTAMENLGFYGRLYPQRIDVEPLLKRVGLWDDRNKRVAEFSKGMKVRLNFVRAMLNNPKMLFLDEPTVGLDPQNARIIKDIILEYRQAGGTVFLTTHAMHDADELCDRVAFIADGEIREIDSPMNLKLRFGNRVVNIEYRDRGLERVSFPMDGLADNQDFLGLLRTKVIVTIHSGETTLDDIFIKVTGVRLHA